MEAVRRSSAPIFLVFLQPPFAMLLLRPAALGRQVFRSSTRRYATEAGQVLQQTF